jgi:hypothetical protein
MAGIMFMRCFAFNASEDLQTKNRPTRHQGGIRITDVVGTTSSAHRTRTPVLISGTATLSRSVAGLDHASHS